MYNVHFDVIDPSYGFQRGPKAKKKWQKYVFLGHSIESILGGKDLGFYIFSYGMLKIFQIFLKTEKTENFFPIFLLEIFHLDFWISGKILS